MVLLGTKRILMALSTNERMDLLSRASEIIANCKESLGWHFACVANAIVIYRSRRAFRIGPCTISRSRVIEIENRRVEMILAKRDARESATTGSQPVRGSL